MVEAPSSQLPRLSQTACGKLRRYANARQRLYYLSVTLYSLLVLAFFDDALHGDPSCVAPTGVSGHPASVATGEIATHNSAEACGVCRQCTITRLKTLRSSQEGIARWGWVEKAVLFVQPGLLANLVRFVVRHFWLVLIWGIFIALVRCSSTKIRQAEQEYAYQKWQRNAAVFTPPLSTNIPKGDLYSRCWVRVACTVALLAWPPLAKLVLLGVVLCALFVVFSVTMCSLGYGLSLIVLSVAVLFSLACCALSRRRISTLAKPAPDDPGDSGPSENHKY